MLTPRGEKRVLACFSPTSFFKIFFLFLVPARQPLIPPTHQRDTGLYFHTAVSQTGVNTHNQSPLLVWKILLIGFSLVSWFGAELTWSRFERKFCIECGEIVADCICCVIAVSFGPPQQVVRKPLSDLCPLVLLSYVSYLNIKCCSALTKRPTVVSLIYGIVSQ